MVSRCAAFRQLCRPCGALRYSHSIGGRTCTSRSPMDCSCFLIRQYSTGSSCLVPRHSSVYCLWLPCLQLMVCLLQLLLYSTCQPAHYSACTHSLLIVWYSCCLVFMFVLAISLFYTLPESTAAHFQLSHLTSVLTWHPLTLPLFSVYT